MGEQIVEQNLVICLWQADQFFAEAEGVKSRYFAITEFINCFIIRSPCLLVNNSLKAQGSDLSFFTQERGYNYT